MADSCYQRKCTSNEHCCDGSICADTKFGGELVSNYVTIPLFSQVNNAECCAKKKIFLYKSSLKAMEAKKILVA